MSVRAGPGGPLTGWRPRGLDRLRVAGPAVLLLLALAGCATGPAPDAGGGAAAGGDAFSLVTEAEYEQQSPTLGVRLEIDAPAPLKALLERHLDLVRLGAIGNEDVDDSEWARLIDASPAQVRQLLQTEGYFAPTVRIERTPGRGGRELDLVRLSVVPGVPATVSRVTLQVDGALERAAEQDDAYARQVRADWERSWELPGGTRFRNDAWNAAKAGALSRLRAAGYASAAWSGTAAAVDLENNTVRLFLVADSGPLYRLGQLQVEGLVAQDAATVRNLAVVGVGAPVTETFLLDFQDRLQTSGLFETVAVVLDTDPARADAADVLVRVREAPLQVYTFGVGFSSNTGARLSVEQVLRRPLDLPLSSKLKLEVGRLRQAWDGEISSRPDDRLYRYLLGGAVERLESSTDAVLAQRLRLGRTQDTQRMERLVYGEWERSSRRPDTGSPVDAVAVSINLHGIWRDLDSIALPTDGETLAVQLGVGRSDGTDAVSGTFSRVYGRLTAYRPLGRAWYGQARVELGRVFLASGMVVPESLRWRAGGDESVRGYSYRELGPEVDGVVAGGDVVATASFELARPFTDAMPSLWGAVFVDLGNAARSFDEWKPRYGAGLGVRWRSPVGPLRIDLAWPDDSSRPRLHFSIGIAF